MNGERDGDGRRRAYAPRRLTSADRSSPRAYRRLLTVFKALGIEDDLEAQLRLTRETHEYWVGKRKSSQRQWSKKDLIDYLRAHPELLAHPDLQRLVRNGGGAAAEPEGGS